MTPLQARIMEVLRTHGPSRSSEIATLLHLKQRSVVNSLMFMRGARLVVQTHDNKWKELA